MKSNLNLYFFTNNFPFGVKEEWKLNEIEELTKLYNVTIIPLEKVKNDTPCQLPSNVKVHNPLINNIPKSYNKVDLLSAFFKNNIILHIKELCKWKVVKLRSNIYRLLHETKFLADLNQNKELNEIFKNEGIFYFYWGKNIAKTIINRKRIDNQYFIARFHGYDLYEYRYNNYIPYQSELLKHLDKILVISDDGKKYLSKKYPSQSKKIKLNRLGTSSIGLSSKSSDGIFRIVSCSRLISLKRVKILAKALMTILDFKIEWTHIGDGPERVEIEKILLSKKPNLNYKILGWMTPLKVKQYYINHKCDLFINISTTEGVPVSIMEAFSAGIPVMATDVGGTSEIVNNSNGVLLTPELNKESLALNIENFSNKSSDEIDDLRKNSYQSYVENCDASRNVRGLLEMLLKFEIN